TLESLVISDYALKSSYTRLTHSHGGVAIYSKNSCKAVSLPINFEQICEDITFEAAGIVVGNTVIVTIYRSSVGDFITFINKMSLLFNKLDLKKDIVVTGDFNVHFNKNVRETRLSVELFLSYALELTINNNNTRGNNCLDNVFTNINSQSWNSLVI